MKITKEKLTSIYGKSSVTSLTDGEISFLRPKVLLLKYFLLLWNRNWRKDRFIRKAMT